MYKSNLKSCIEKLRSASLRGTLAASIVYREAIKRSLGGTSPSAPGQPPGLRSGNLQSAVAILSGEYKDDSTVYIGLNGNGGTGKTPPWLYGIYLEGGASAGRPRPFKLPNGQWRMRKNPMLPRPFMRPAAENSQIAAAAVQKFQEIAKQELK